MDVSELRKRIMRALEEAGREATTRRAELDAARKSYETLHDDVIVPLLRQAQSVLRAEGKLFTVHAPADEARLAADSSPETFLEFELEISRGRPQVIGRRSVALGGKRVDVEERPISPTKPIADLKDEDIAAFLVAEIPKLVGGRA
jgi:hypothetical protein